MFCYTYLMEQTKHLLCGRLKSDVTTKWKSLRSKQNRLLNHYIKFLDNNEFLLEYHFFIHLQAVGQSHFPTEETCAWEESLYGENESHGTFLFPSRASKSGLTCVFHAV